MLKESQPSQFGLEMVTLDELVPQGHLLRLIDHYIDFDFIFEEVRDLYCADNGRPPIDPVRLFKMLFIGYLFGIRSERQLVKEIQVNVAYRWFLGLGLTDKVPDASTLSQNRRRRFVGQPVYQQIFDRIVEQAMEAGLVSGQTLYTDSTHLKANANKHRFESAQVPVPASQYLQELDAAVDEAREEAGKKPLARDEAPKTKTIKQSTTDPDSGYMTREGKPQGFFYLDHRTVDGQQAIITDTHVTAGNVHDSQPYLQRLDRQQDRFGFAVQSVGLDAGYFTSAVCQGLEDRDVYGVIGYRRPNHSPNVLRKRDFHYEADTDSYRCIEDHALTFRTIDRRGYREYKSDGKHCQHCPRLQDCTRSKNTTKVIVRHVWEGAKERINQHRLTLQGKAIYKRRKETVERSFADAKQLHGHRYARMRGIDRVREQCLLSAACQNMKKIAMARAKRAFLRLIVLTNAFNDATRHDLLLRRCQSALCG